jgi:hypothetical protein
MNSALPQISHPVAADRELIRIIRVFPINPEYEEEEEEEEEEEVEMGMEVEVEVGGVGAGMVPPPQPAENKRLKCVESNAMDAAPRVNPVRAMPVVIPRRYEDLLDSIC